MPLRIAIIGGGLGGLTLAAALTTLYQQDSGPESGIDDIEVDIYEAAVALTQVGAGITLWPRAWDIYRRMGLEDDLKGNLSPGQKPPTTAEPRLNFSFRKSDTRNGEPIFDLIFAGAAVFIHRPILLDLLLRRISTKFRFHLSHRLTSYQEQLDKTISLSFENGVSAQCNVLVGADGIKSAVRKYFLSANPPNPAPPEISDPVWSGTFAFRCMISKSSVADRLPNHRVLNTPIIYCGKNKHIVAYPMPELETINIIAYASDPSLEGTQYQGPSFTDITVEEMLPIFAGWEEEVVAIAENMSKASRWAIHSLRPLEKYARDRVILLGDAAHAMTPHQGNGAGQAIEDAFVLAHCLYRAHKLQRLPVENASAAYNAIRRPFGNFVLDASRKHGLLYEFNDPEFSDVKEGDVSVGPERLARFAEKVQGDWEYAWSTYVDEDLEKASTLLQAQAKF